MLDVLVALDFVLGLDLNDFFLQLLGSLLLAVDEDELLLGLCLVLADLLLKARQHFCVIPLLSSEHVDVVLEFVVVGDSIIVGGDGFVEIRL